MPANVVTPEDLVAFRDQLLSDIKQLLEGRTAAAQPKWLKSHEVRRLLKISPGTLQNLRVNGSLPYTKIGGVMYYDAEDIQRMLTENKRVPSNHILSLEKTFTRSRKPDA